MKRGSLRVLLGAAPGVGKTYEMLSEGHRLLADGRDVVVGIVETHGRAATSARAEGLPTLGRRRLRHREVELDELDLDGLLDRHPEIALVDELAHTNAPGSRNEKRWQDVEELLAAGIDVITTVNVQHIASLGGVVAQITGSRSARRCRMPWCAPPTRSRSSTSPQSLRDRLAAGAVYPAERIDALSNYFRLGNLTALRELALLWLADEVDSALQSYREEHGIRGAWQARERVVVALTGGPEGDTLLQRGARIAARAAGGELLAVHVTTQEGCVPPLPGPRCPARTRRVARRQLPPGDRRGRAADPRRVRAIGQRDAARAGRQPPQPPRRGVHRPGHRGHGHPRVGRHRRAHRHPRRRGRNLHLPRVTGGRSAGAGASWGWSSRSPAGRCCRGCCSRPPTRRRSPPTCSRTNCSWSSWR
jgi:hypothetical protein